MGFDPASLALLAGAGSSIFGAISGYNENKAARKRQAAATDAGVALTQGSNPVDQLIMQKLSQPNVGQDGFLQYLRSNPNGLQPYMYDQSKAFKGLQAQDAYVTNDQVNQLRAGAGSLGERFGTGFASKEAMLRSRIAAGIDARNAGISQSSFNTALQYGQSGYAMGQQQNNSLLGLLLSSQQGRTGQQLQALGLAAQPLQSSGNPIGQGGVDIAQLLLLKQFLGGGSGGGTGPLPPTTTPAGNFGAPIWNPGAGWTPSQTWMR